MQGADRTISQTLQRCASSAATAPWQRRERQNKPRRRFQPPQWAQATLRCHCDQVAILPLPSPDAGGRDWVDDHLGHLFDGPAIGSPAFRGGQRSADAALAAFDVRGYAATRNEVAPIERRGASRLSPYIRHGLLPLPEVWRAVAGGPNRDVEKFRDELLWQEYSRHWYARLGRATANPVRNAPTDVQPGDGWDRMLPCLNAVVGELEQDGWLVNQTRMWLAGDWTVRHGQDWRLGEDRFFRHLLDGSRAANRLGWQWTTGVGSNKPYGFSRWQVEKRAPGLCKRCPHRDACPIDAWPDEPSFVSVDWPAEVDLTGPDEIVTHAAPDTVWLTAESLGTTDPAPRSIRACRWFSSSTSRCSPGCASTASDWSFSPRRSLNSPRVTIWSSGSATRSTNSWGAASPSPMPPCPASLIEHR